MKINRVNSSCRKRKQDKQKKKTARKTSFEKNDGFCSFTENG